MVRKLTEDQENFAAYAWMLAQHRIAVAEQLAYVEQYEREARCAAGQYGVKQKTLAALTGRSPGRISQIISEYPAKTGSALMETRETWRRALDEPSEHLALHERKFTTAETIATWDTNFNLVHGEETGIF
ncbi:hypothetical protein MB46_19235 (plasmid) [Arthrobacter alpinus]|uniref:hypothetical protein n=1 Tax=Arthrobacter alpinus TaxID=656366 RepID=UPI0005C93523|nr:hypothetical protein [Arthrobacter alpinus]ALV47816.1 hypothetical protein MB46_19235 [Arthrobacter alpinus]